MRLLGRLLEVTFLKYYTTAPNTSWKMYCVPNTAPGLTKSITLPVPLLKMERDPGTHVTVLRSSKSLHTCHDLYLVSTLYMRTVVKDVRPGPIKANFFFAK